MVDDVTSAAECTHAVGEFHLAAVVGNPELDVESGLRVVKSLELINLAGRCSRTLGAFITVFAFLRQKTIFANKIECHFKVI